MRTLIFIVVGLLLAVLATRAVPRGKRTGMAVLFTGGWLAAVFWNLRTGMSHGYSFAEEAPIQALIFIVPVAAAWWLALRHRP